MKLMLKISTAVPRVEKIKLEPELVELFDAYMDYYKKQLSMALTEEQVIKEIMSAFMKSDREFTRWYHQRTVKHEKAIEP